MSDNGIDARDAVGTSPTLVCWGELLWDVYPDGKRLGGAPANVAFHLAALGESVALITRVGDDALGREAVDAMRAAGVDTSLVQIDSERPTGVVEVNVRDGEPRYTLNAGCAWERIEATPAACEAIGRAAALCFGSLSQIRDEGKRSFRDALAAKPPACTAICDINLRPGHVDAALARWHLDAADAVKLNDQEAALLAAHLGAADIVTYLQREAGVGLIALTRGPRGSRLVRGDEVCDHPGFTAQPGGDNVGAGDAFTAVLARAVCRGLPLERANVDANRYAAFVASHRGATPAPTAELLAMIA